MRVKKLLKKRVDTASFILSKQNIFEGRSIGITQQEQHHKNAIKTLIENKLGCNIEELIQVLK